LRALRRLALRGTGHSLAWHIAAVQVFYSDHFVLPLPAGHRFPMRKYAMLRDRVARELPGIRLHEAPAASDGELALAHEPAYIARVAEGTLSAAEQREIGFPWSMAMAERARRSVGATVAACRAALQGQPGIAANLAGGTHHAYANKGAGFCVFNDAAVAARLMQAEWQRMSGTAGVSRGPLRVAIVDCDVHQGNGTASIFTRDDTVFTLSLHGEKNFPFRKEASDIDIDLPDGIGDDAYLHALTQALAQLDARFAPQLLIYLAGADPYEHDRLGRLKLTTAGLQARDRTVLHWAAARKLPVVLTMAGGYCERIEETVNIQFNTLALACSMAGEFALPAGGRVRVAADYV
jgi:acetoin utilization deacetylase AcuC-like enzyme